MLTKVRFYRYSLNPRTGQIDHSFYKEEAVENEYLHHTVSMFLDNHFGRIEYDDISLDNLKELTDYINK